MLMGMSVHSSTRPFVRCLCGVSVQVERAVADDMYTLLSRRCAEEETKMRTLAQKAKYAKGAAKTEAEHMLKEAAIKKSCDLKLRLFGDRY